MLMLSFANPRFAKTKKTASRKMPLVLAGVVRQMLRAFIDWRVSIWISITGSQYTDLRQFWQSEKTLNRVFPAVVSSAYLAPAARMLVKWAIPPGNHQLPLRIQLS